MHREQNILILGATGGIGKSIAEKISKGNQIILCSKNEDRLVKLKQTIHSSNNLISHFEADLSVDTEVNELICYIQKHHQKIDWIINTAGHIDENEPDDDSSYDQVLHSYLVNTISPIRIVQGLKNQITDTGGIIMISSTASLSNNPSFPIYASSKGALNVYTLAIARQFEHTSKKAILICPGGTNTPMREKITDDAHLLQSPNVVAEQVQQIIAGASNITNGDNVIITDSVVKIAT